MINVPLNSYNITFSRSKNKIAYYSIVLGPKSLGSSYYQSKGLVYCAAKQFCFLVSLSKTHLLSLKCDDSLTLQEAPEQKKIAKHWAESLYTFNIVYRTAF